MPTDRSMFPGSNDQRKAYAQNGGRGDLAYQVHQVAAEKKRVRANPPIPKDHKENKYALIICKEIGQRGCSYFFCQ